MNHSGFLEREIAQYAYLFQKKKLSPRAGHLAEFLALRCAGDLVDLKYFKTPEDIVNAMALFKAIREYKHAPKPWDKNVVLLAGEPQSNALAAMFAYRTKWHCISPEWNSDCLYDGTIDAPERLYNRAWPSLVWRVRNGATFVAVSTSPAPIDNKMTRLLNKFLPINRIVSAQIGSDPLCTLNIQDPEVGVIGLGTQVNGRVL